ncbi:MAG: DUF1566 domain-containing protein [Methylotenera sp.]|nr:DUF1566 domain-containing protein [Methylotenera sp.]
MSIYAIFHQIILKVVKPAIMKKHNSNITEQIRTRLTPRSPFIAGLLLLVSLLLSVSSLGFAQSAEAPSLPDLGTPAANTGSVQPNINAQGAGFNYRDNIGGKLISITPQYNQQNGTSIGGSLAGALSKNMAVGVLLSVGSDRNEWLLNTGFDLTSNQRFIFTLGQLSQKLDFNFISGKQKTQVRQDNFAGSYQYFLGKDWLNAAEVNAYISNTGSVNLGAKTYFTDTTSLYELWSDPRRIAGGRVTGVQGRLVFTPTSKSSLKLGFGGERLTYDLLTGNDSTTRATGSAEFNQRLDYGFNLRASANAGASQSRYALGLGKSFIDGSQLGLDVATIQGRDNTFNDNQVMLNYTQSFGGSTYAGNPLGMNNPTLNNNALSNLDAAGAPMNPAPVNTTATNPTAANWASSLVDQVSRRPSFLPAQVIAKVDTTATPTRLIAIDKTAVPVGSSINTATGAITAPTGTPVSGIAGVTKNAAAFTNAGQFALSGTGLLVVNPSLITQPAVGVTDTYVVTMNNISGGGTTLATVIVSQGSTKIDSIVMSSGIITPTLSGLGLSATSVAFGTAAPTITAPTSASSGAITYTSGTVGTATITSGGVITLVGVGTTIITATQAADGNYASTTTTITLTVTAATPSLSGLGLSATSVALGTAAPTITAPTSVSAGAITYTSGTVGTATITSGGVITLVGVGTTVITATQAANGNYASTTATITLTVTPAPLPVGAVVSVGLTWTRDNSTVANPGYANWTTANNTCNALTAQGLAAGSWRLPTQAELSALYTAGTGALTTAGWAVSGTWSSTASGAGHNGVNLGNGNVFSTLDTADVYVSCVR